MPSLADAVVAAQTLRSGTVLAAGDLRHESGAELGPDAADRFIGQQLRAMVSAGRVIDPSMLAAPKLIERNQIVKIAFERNALRIEAEGRALNSGAIGEMVRVINSNSRVTLTGRVAADGSVLVSN